MYSKKPKQVRKNVDNTTEAIGSRRSSRIQAKTSVVLSSSGLNSSAMKEINQKKDECQICLKPATRKDSNECIICDSLVHEACFASDVPKRLQIPSFCCLFAFKNNKKQTRN